MKILTLNLPVTLNGITFNTLQSRFEVHSTNSDNKYGINLSSYTCTCSDFPRIQLCKHLAATIHFFGGEKEGEFGPQAPDNASEPDMPKSPVPRDGSTKSRASVISAVNDVARLAQEILEVAPANPDPEMAKSIQMARSQLNAIRLSMNDSASRLPEKEQIAPNQLSWPPTAARMGVKRGEKRRRKVDSALTADHIGVPKRKRPTDDPYGAGEHSGKRAKPDAVSTAANTRARAAKEKAAERPPLPTAPPASLPTRLPSPASLPTCLPPPASLPVRLPPPSPAPYAQTYPMHAPALYSRPAHFPIPSVPYSQPTYFPYPGSQPAPHFTPMFSPYTFHPPA